MADKKLFLLDAYALIYRAYFAMAKNPLINSKGMNVSAIHGFTNYLVDILTKHQPTHIGVAFDTAADTERHTDFADYKAHRQSAPEDITMSLPYIKTILEAMRIPSLEKDGYEADDVIGTIAKQAEEKGYEVFMVTPDKDYGQLVSDRVKIFKPPYMGTGFEIMGPEQIKAKWNIPDVKYVVDILGLMGDASDNIPGLPGVGEKTAAKLVNEFGTVENLVASSDKLTGKLKENVQANKDIALLSKKLATIICNVPIEWTDEQLIVEPVDKEKLVEIFKDLEFRNLGKRILGYDYTLTNANATASAVGGGVDMPVSSYIAETKASPKRQTNLFGEEIAVAELPQLEVATADKTIENTPHEYFLCDTAGTRNDLVALLKKSALFCFDTETNGLDPNQAELVGLSFAVKPSEAYYVPLPADQQEAKEILEEFRPILEDETKQLVGQNIKFDMLVLKWYGIEIKNKLWDTMLAHYLIEPDMRHNMDYLSETYLGYTPISIKSLIGRAGKKQLTMRDVDVNKVCDYAAEDADITLQLKEKFEPMLTQVDDTDIFHSIEEPLSVVLCDMEYEGVAIDVPFLHDYSSQLEKELKDVEEKVYEHAGVRFNIASPKQLGEVLFDKLKIPFTGKRTATGQTSTDAKTLDMLGDKHPIVQYLRDFRELSKLKSTYIDALPTLINPKTGRVHTSFNQAVAATGRLSSTDPNLQNIPIRTERGREIRKAFIPRNDDYTILSADYSQIELRLIASLSEDPNMMEAFHKGLDVHTATAAKIFNVPLDQVTKDMRGKAKTVNFGISYGQTSFGLSQVLKCSKAEAQALIDSYKAEFVNVVRLMDFHINFARENGYVKTLLGRKRYIRDINSGNFTVRGQAERFAINAPLQGSAADMIKLAMIRVDSEFKKRKLKSRMTLQVHDELIFDAHKSEVEEIKPIIANLMKEALPLKVPIEIGMGTGVNWLEAH